MENQSQDQASRRHRGNRSGGRSRSRQGNQSPQSGSSGGRNRSRNRSGSRSNQPSKQTAFQKILSVLTFGLFGKPKAKAKAQASPARKSEAPKTAKPTAKPQAQRKGGEESPKPKRNRAEVTSGRIYVGNLDYSTGEVELEELFRGVGNVLSAEVVTNPRTQQSKGFAFVEMGSVDEAKRAVSILDDQEFMGRKLIVSGARSDGPEGDGETALAGNASENRG